MRTFLESDHTYKCGVKHVRVTSSDIIGDLWKTDTALTALPPRSGHDLEMHILLHRRDARNNDTQDVGTTAHTLNQGIESVDS